MAFDNNKDPRPKDRTAWVEQFRKVKPVLLGVKGGFKPVRTPSNGRVAPVASGLETYSGPWTDVQVRHLLRRTLFGIRKAELDTFIALTMDQAVSQLLTPSPTPGIPYNDYEGSDANAQDPNVPLGETWIEAPHAGVKEGYRITSLKGWANRNMIFQESTIHEKMKFFWSNLLPAKWWDVYIAKTGYAYYATLHQYALGNYRDLIKAITLDPSMLIFLNGTYNNKDAPDENYGRELQELFCIGKGAGSHYTEDDVKAAARVLTGWQINWDAYSNPGLFLAHFESLIHDINNKQFSSFYNSTVITGKVAKNGALELDELLDMIIGTDESSRYICRRIYSFFVFSEIDATTEQNIIGPLATIFRNNNYEILPVLNALFRSAHFYDAANVGAMIKNPIDHVIGLFRCLHILPAPSADLNTNYRIHASLHWHMANMGLEIGDPPNVAGWPAYYEAPTFDKTWITTDTITKRASTTDAFINFGYYYYNNIFLKADLPAFVSKLDQPEDPTALIQDASRLLFGMDLSVAVVTNLKTVLLSGQATDAYWTGAWNTYQLDTTNADNRAIVNLRLQAMFRNMLQLGEYHLM